MLLALFFRWSCEVVDHHHHSVTSIGKQYGSTTQIWSNYLWGGVERARRGQTFWQWSLSHSNTATSRERCAGLECLLAVINHSTEPPLYSPCPTKWHNYNKRIGTWLGRGHSRFRVQLYLLHLPVWCQARVARLHRSPVFILFFFLSDPYLLSLICLTLLKLSNLCRLPLSTYIQPEVSVRRPLELISAELRTRLKSAFSLFSHCFVHRPFLTEKPPE